MGFSHPVKRLNPVIFRGFICAYLCLYLWFGSVDAFFWHFFGQIIHTRTMNKTELLHKAAAARILLLDGAMGSLIQQYKLSEEGFRGTRFAAHNSPVQGNNDLLSLTRPDIISSIHEQYLEAGSDIIETNTFNANRISQADYGMEDLVYELNKTSAALAAEAAKKFSTPERPRFVAGSMGPTNKTASLSPDVNNPGYRAVSFDDLAEFYAEQV